MRRGFVRLLAVCGDMLRWIVRWLHRRTDRHRWSHRTVAAVPLRVFAQPKPEWVKQEIIRLKALLPLAGCRTIAHHFNRRWAARRDMTVSKTYVADTCRRHQYLIYEARRKLKHRVPRPMRRNRVWGCDLLTKTDQHGTRMSRWPSSSMPVAPVCGCNPSRTSRRGDCYTNWCRQYSGMVGHNSCGRTMKRCLPQHGLRGGYACSVFSSSAVSQGARGRMDGRSPPLGNPMARSRHHSIDRCGGRFIGTVKRELRQEALTGGDEFEHRLTGIRPWYNHDRPHDHLQGQTPAEVWAGIDVFRAKPG
ncbi:MAG TPA: integrase core domain-containing protein [Nitrospira sp.]|nr:integrase core domain-containing protein [Nitrospira sp.]